MIAGSPHLPAGQRSSIAFMISSAHRTVSAIALTVGELSFQHRIGQLARSENAGRDQQHAFAALVQLKWSNCQTPTPCVALALATSSSIRFFIAGWGTLPGSKNLEAHGIANSERVIGCCCRQTEVAMKIDLLMRRDLVCRTEIDHVLRTAALGKGTGIFDVSVPELRKLPVKIHARLARQISPWSLGWPHNREHSSNCPVLCQ
jgi:hypothetical protein